MKITIIAALDENGAIGRGDGLPWHIPQEMQHFHREIKGKPVIAVL